MCITDCHDITLAAKVALNPNTTNNSLQSFPFLNFLLLNKNVDLSKLKGFADKSFNDGLNL